MEALAGVSFGPEGKTLMVKLEPMEVAQIVSSRYGFYDLDIDSGPQGIKIVATSDKRTMTVNGKTTAEAVERLVGILNG